MKKEIKEFPGYFVNPEGRVFSHRRKQPIELKRQLNIDGYNVVNMVYEGKNYHRRVARLVAEAFIENPKNLPIVNHIDHVRTNDHMSNLEWCDPKYNTNASKSLFPERWRGNCVIDESMAHKICKCIQDGMRNKEVVEELDVTIDTVKSIRSGESWKKISKDYNLVRSKRAVSDSTVRWICQKILEGLPNREIVKQSYNPNVKSHLVKSIRGKRSWSSISNEYF